MVTYGDMVFRTFLEPLQTVAKVVSRYVGKLVFYDMHILAKVVTFE
jgi:hypothetical protein